LIERALPYRTQVTVAPEWLRPKGAGGKRYTRTNVTTTTPAGTPWARVAPIPSGLFGPVELRRE
jgi:hypothetical protein